MTGQQFREVQEDSDAARAVVRAEDRLLPARRIGIVIAHRSRVPVRAQPEPLPAGGPRRDHDIAVVAFLAVERIHGAKAHLAVTQTEGIGVSRQGRPEPSVGRAAGIAGTEIALIDEPVPGPVAREAGRSSRGGRGIGRLGPGGRRRQHHHHDRHEPERAEVSG